MAESITLSQQQIAGMIISNNLIKKTLVFRKCNNFISVPFIFHDHSISTSTLGILVRNYKLHISKQNQAM